MYSGINIHIEINVLEKRGIRCRRRARKGNIKKEGAGSMSGSFFLGPKKGQKRGRNVVYHGIPWDSAKVPGSQ